MMELMRLVDNFESVILNKNNSKRIKRINELIDSKINTKLFWTPNLR